MLLETGSCTVALRYEGTDHTMMSLFSSSGSDFRVSIATARWGKSAKQNTSEFFNEYASHDSCVHTQTPLCRQLTIGNQMKYIKQ